jgi:hypothetical protein
MARKDISPTPNGEKRYRYFANTDAFQLMSPPLLSRHASLLLPEFDFWNDLGVETTNWIFLLFA